MMKYLFFGIVLLAACTPKPKEPILTWYKGNTHTHTVLCGHADTPPDTVALWYLDRDYNFLILSEHNTFINPDSVNLPENRRTNFILIAGEELSDEKEIHTTAMNINRLVQIGYPFKYDSIKNNTFDDLKVFYMQKHVDSTRNAGGIPILNHPNWQSGASAAEIQQVDRLHMIELYNGHPDVNNWGNKRHASMEQKWDSLLTAGRKIYGVSSDDAHFFHDWGVDVSNPGRGWVMVQSEQLTPDAITDAMAAGKFYSSSGVMLKEIQANKEQYAIEVDVDATLKAIESPYVVGYKNEKADDGFLIEFITDKGNVLQGFSGTSVKIDVPADVTYIRGKVTYSRTRSSKSEQFFAWTQPVFLN